MKLARKIKFIQQELRVPTWRGFEQQQQFMAWVTEWLGGTTIAHLIIPTNVSSGGTTTSASANVINLAGITGQVLILSGVTLASSANSSTQILSNTTNSNSGGTNFGSAFGVHTAQNTNFLDTSEVNMETFPAQYMYATQTIGGTVTTCQFYVAAIQIKKIV